MSAALMGLGGCALESSNTADFDTADESVASSREASQATAGSVSGSANKGGIGQTLPTISIANGVITMIGTQWDDTATVQRSSCTNCIGMIDVEISNAFDTVRKSFYTWTVTKVVFEGRAGNDRFSNRTDKTSNANGGDGNDILIGGPGQDLLSGGSGNDVLVTVGGGTGDIVQGNGGLDSFWVDVDDWVVDASQTETNEDYLHEIDGFLDYIKNGDSISVGTEPNGEPLEDPDPRTAAPELDRASFASHPLFPSGGPTYRDVRQSGALGNCTFMAKLASLAHTNPEYIKNMVTTLGDGTYAVRFFNASTRAPEYVRVDGDLWVYPSNLKTIYGHPSDAEGAIWAPILEKAYAFYRKRSGTTAGTYESLEGGGSATLQKLGIAYNPAIPQGEGVYEFFPSPAPGINPIRLAIDGSMVVDYALGHLPDVYDAQYIGAQIESNAAEFLYAVKAELDAGRGLIVPMSASATGSPNYAQNQCGNGQPWEVCYRITPHEYAAISVETDSSGVPVGMTAYNPYGHEVVFSNLVEVYFFISSAKPIVVH